VLLKILRKLAWTLALTGLGLGGCASVGPVFIPFAADKAGSTASQTIHVTKESGWEVQLLFPTPKGGVDKKTFEHLMDAANSISGASTSPTRPPRGMQLRLTVTQNQYGQSMRIKDESISQQRLSRGEPGAIGLHLDALRLQPGEYVVTVQALEDEPRLVGIPVALSVGTTWK